MVPQNATRKQGSVANIATYDEKITEEDSYLNQWEQIINTHAVILVSCVPVHNVINNVINISFFSVFFEESFAPDSRM